MAKEEKEEVKEDGEGNENRSDGNKGARGQGGEQGGESSSGGSSSGGSGGKGGEQGTQGGEQGGSGGGSGSGSGEQGSSGGDKKIDLLQRIRAKRANGLDNPGSSTDGANNEHRPNDERGVRGGNRGAKDDNGTTPGTNRSNRRSSKQNSNSSGGTRESSQTNDRTAITTVGDEKPAGVAIKGADKIKQLALAATEAARAEAPKVKFTWDKEALSKKEGDEILPKIKGLLEFIFRHADKGITISNRNRAEAHIWSSIDDEDIDIIATHLVEMGKASRIVATAVRRMTNSYRLLQIGLITLPKFIQTYQFYAANGGFALGK